MKRSLQTRAAGLLAALAMIALACAAQAPAVRPRFVENSDCGPPRRPLPRIETIELTAIGRTLAVDVEVATSPGERQRGLMCRAVVPDGTGMLFELPAESSRGFWMYNTYVPLDLLYLDAAGVAVATASLRPCPRASGEGDAAWQTRCSEEAAPHAPAARFNAVLELPAGWLEAQGVPLEGASGAVRLVRP